MDTQPPSMRVCGSCDGSGESPTENGVVDCPDCGGSGHLPDRSVLVDWRARDIERALSAGITPIASDVQWLLAELRQARTALTEIVALAHDSQDPDAIALKIRFVGGRALGLQDSKKDN